MAPNYRERIGPVDPDRFRFALGLFQAAAAMRGPFDNSQQFGVNIEDVDGSVMKIGFTDIPANRGMLAVKKEFPDKTEFERLGFRILTFPEILRDRRLVRWGFVRDRDDGGKDVHDAVINALAQAPYRKSGSLDKSAFLALVKSEHNKLESES